MKIGSTVHPQDGGNGMSIALGKAGTLAGTVFGIGYLR
jgi:hypothetical protein